jgi:hypothetical protein
MKNSGVDSVYLEEVLKEIRYQPAWRVQADREMDYRDGNQLNSDILRMMESLGIPPSIENLVGSVCDRICGDEEENRTDLKVEPDGDKDEEAEQIAAAISYKLNQAERRSGMDKACSEVYASQMPVGIGWIHVTRETDPFKFPYKVEFIHRNFIHWDWSDSSADLNTARWLLRRKWVNKKIAEMMFPNKKDIIKNAGSGWNTDTITNISLDSPGATDLYQSSEIERGWTIEEQEWWMPGTNKICLFELLTRKWEQVKTINLGAGRVEEFNIGNIEHLEAIEAGTELKNSMVPRIFKTFFVGPHKVFEEESEFKSFNYIPFWGKREDRTNIPYGVLRPLIYPQDERNARVSKQQWLLGAKWTVRTDGAVIQTDEVFRQMSGRPDADFILDQQHMALEGSMFEIHSNEQLSEQQYKRSQEVKEIIEDLSHQSASTRGEERNGNLGEMDRAISQSAKGLAAINSNFFYGRTKVAELLISMIIKDIGEEQHDVTIKGSILKEDRKITLNAPAVDENGREYLTNNVQRAVLKVGLSEVSSKSSFNKHEMTALSELGKSLPEEYRAAIAPFIAELSSVNNKEELVKALMEVKNNTSLTEDQVAERVKAAVEEARVKWMVEQKTRELDLKEEKQKAEIEKLISEAVNSRIESIFSGTQAALQINSVPGIAGTTDQILNSSGFEDKDLAPIVAEGPITAPPEITQNTSPMFPPRVQEPDVEQSQIQALPAPDSAVTGAREGIEAPGVQL